MRIKLLNGRWIHPTITKVVKQRLEYCIYFSWSLDLTIPFITTSNLYTHR